LTTLGSGKLPLAIAVSRLSASAVLVTAWPLTAVI